MILLLGLVVVQVAFVAAGESSMCPKGIPVFNCWRDPCMTAKCPAKPEARCVQNYCGGCGYDFYVGKAKVDCKKKETRPKLPTRPKQCPSISCPGGKFVDCKRIDGCLFCSCAPLCPPKVPCPPDCLTVTYKGCPVSCKCEAAPPPICPLAMCMMHCENGFQVDKNGCDMCKCKLDPVPVCPLVMCPMFCKNGFKVDKNGCEMCKCKAFIPIEMRHGEAGAPGTK